MAWVSGDGKYRQVSVRTPAAKLDLWGEVLSVQQMEKEVKHRWRMEIPKLEKMLA